MLFGSRCLAKVLVRTMCCHTLGCHNRCLPKASCMFVREQAKAITTTMSPQCHMNLQAPEQMAARAAKHSGHIQPTSPSEAVSTKSQKPFSATRGTTGALIKARGQRCSQLCSRSINTVCRCSRSTCSIDFTIVSCTLSRKRSSRHSRQVYLVILR